MDLNFAAKELQDSFYGLKDEIAHLKKIGKTVGMCHGCFDPLHLGHVRHFKEAKSCVDILVITVTPDFYINKGPNRPYFNMYDRLEILKELQCVDYACINLWPTAERTLMEFRPNFYFKGIDYVKSNDAGLLKEKQTIEQYGGRLIFTKTKKDSSTELISKGVYDGYKKY